MRDITLNDIDTKNELPVHIIMYIIKTKEKTRMGLPSQPASTLTTLGWVVISPAHKNTVTNKLFLKKVATSMKMSVI